MGVRGFNRVLQNLGWLPPATDLNYTCGCSIRPWKAEHGDDDLSNRPPPFQKIPAGSLLLIDGNGLAFYLHSVAYARYLRSMSPSSERTADACPRTDQLKPEQVSTALPSMLPLSVLHQVTIEFVADMESCNVQMEVFWDGKLRRFKARTDQDRRQQRLEEESNLEQYCRHGNLPQETYCCQWQDHFPLSIMFTTCVQHALRGFSCIAMVEYLEEADIGLALKASGNAETFVMGYDSDFFFYKDIQYIPFHQMKVGPSGLHAFCARRCDVACSLGVQDHQMVEIALLMGNDYVDPFKLQLPNEINIRHVDSIVAYLQANDFEAVAKDEVGQRAVNFVRALYELDSIEDFPFDKAELEEDSDDDDDENSGLEIASDLVGSGPEVHETNSSIADSVLQFLQAKAKQAKDNGDDHPIFCEDIVSAFKIAVAQKGHHSDSQSLLVRPQWEDMQAKWFIQSILLRPYRQLPVDSTLVRSIPLHSALDTVRFFSALLSLRAAAKPGRTPPPSGHMKTKGQDMTSKSSAAKGEVVLPIDEFETEILQNIRQNRVTIIHGETGCGKSTRVPIMLLNAPAPDGSKRQVKFFVSQPRRIAAKALVERVRKSEPRHEHKFALRMGHGWREHESEETQVTFVTTGYLVRLLAHHPERFAKCTHLVIDEVHERSVDTDILCLLCRRLLVTNKDIRLVLMSATLATDSYREYFNIDNEPIHVGTRRFQIQEFFLEDIASFKIPASDKKSILEIQKEISEGKCNSAPNVNQIGKRVSVAVRLTTIVARKGSSVLIFVPGMGEIIAITEAIEKIQTAAGVEFKCFPIHSDIPFEEQMTVFDEPGENEVKVIVATNAAKSSITLPSVDHVICFGLCRQMQYNQKSHRQILMPAWISRASATQRAGRTGRVRSGSVYRLYTRDAFETYMDEFEPGEMKRIPLDSVILMLKQILHEEVKPVFKECLEPPDVATIENSFQSLHRWSFLSGPDDQSTITPLGAFVSSLGVDLSLGSLIGLGIQFGVAAEAIQMAAIMSVSRTPFQVTSLNWLSPSEFNEGASQTYIAKCKFDDELFSEPFAVMNALWAYEKLPKNGRNGWYFKNRLAIKRWQQVVSACTSLCKRVAEFLGINESRLRVGAPPSKLPRAKLTILRVLQVWVFSESIIECKPSALVPASDGSVNLSIKGTGSNKISEKELSQVLNKKQQPYIIKESNVIEQKGAFREEGEFVLASFISEFEKGLLSYMSETSIRATFCYSKDSFFLYVEENGVSDEDIRFKISSFEDSVDVSRMYAFSYSDIKQQGKKKRKSGAWTIQDTAVEKGQVSAKKSFLRVVFSDDKDEELFGTVVRTLHSDFCTINFEAAATWYFFSNGYKKKKKKNTSTQLFSVSLRGNCMDISQTNMQDTLCRELTTLTTSVSATKQSIVFRATPQAIESSNRLIPSIPVGARLLAFLASSQRKSCTLHFPVEGPSKTRDAKETTSDFEMAKAEVNVLHRWKRLETEKVVFVDESLPASAIHTSRVLYAVASNSLDLNGGKMRVEGLTLLPPNPLFVLLSFLSFGLDPDNSMSHDATEERTEDAKVDEGFVWLQKRGPVYMNGMDDSVVLQEDAVKEKIRMACAFHSSCMSMGEQLVCFSKQVVEFCHLFDGIDGRHMSTWESLDESALTKENLAKWRDECKTRPSIDVNATAFVQRSVIAPSSVQRPPSRETAMAKEETIHLPMVALSPEAEIERLKGVQTRNVHKKDKHRFQLKTTCLDTFIAKTKLMSKRWFATQFNASEEHPRLSSPTNVLALVFSKYGDLIGEGSDDSHTRFTVELNTDNWSIKRLSSPKDPSIKHYRAQLVNFLVPRVRGNGRGKRMPKWIKKGENVPRDLEGILSCLPPNATIPEIVTVKANGKLNGFWFGSGSIQAAVEMESAFWLEKQFCNNRQVVVRSKRQPILHWYEQTIDQMVASLLYERDRLSSAKNAAKADDEDIDDDDGDETKDDADDEEGVMVGKSLLGGGEAKDENGDGAAAAIVD